MPDNHSDQLIRNKLRDHVSSVPADMWERVRQKKEKDRKLIIFWIGCFVACFSFLIYFAVSHFINNHFTGNPIISTHFAKAKNPVVIANPSSARTLVLTHRPPASPVTVKDNSSGSPVRIIDNVSMLKKRTMIARASSATTSNALSNSDPNDLPVSSLSAPSAFPSQPATSVLSKNLSRPISSPSIQQRKTAIAAGSDPAAYSSPSASPKPPSSMTASPASAIKTPNRKYRNWYLDIYGSPDLPFNRIGSSDPSLTQSLEGSVKMQLSYSLGLSLTRSFSKHFAATIGLQYSRINGLSQADSNFFASYEHFSCIDIPLLVGYQWGDEHIRWAINTGIIYNIYTRYSTGLPSSSTGPIYKQANGICLYLGLNYARQLDKKWFLFAEPYFRYRLSNMATDSQPFNRKINTVGISIGLRYYFKMPVH